MKKLSPAYFRYINSPNWKRSFRRKLALNLLFGRDVLCPLLKAHDVEHLNYKRVDFQHCTGDEIPFLDLLPLNRFTHRQMITPLKDVLRFCLGRRMGNAIVAHFLRACLLFWYWVVWRCGWFLIDLK